MAQVKKLSVATVYGKIKLTDLVKAQGANKDIPLMRVYGSAVSTKKGLSSMGEWEALQGRFKAVNMATGEESEAATLFLPSVALVPIQVALAAPEARGVEFAILLSAKYSEKSATRYEYTWEPILPPGEDDPIARLEKKMLAIAGPKADESADGAVTPPTPVASPKKGSK